MLAKIIHKLIINSLDQKLSKIFYNIWSLYVLFILRYIVILLILLNEFQKMDSRDTNLI
jgi:hypothetical protein